jgi:hypothetical protein
MSCHKRVAAYAFTHNAGTWASNTKLYVSGRPSCGKEGYWLQEKGGRPCDVVGPAA